MKVPLSFFGAIIDLNGAIIEDDGAITNFERAFIALNRENIQSTQSQDLEVITDRVCRKIACFEVLYK